ncbi:DUF4307 domain-containing protein [Streptomyces sp. DSM 44915]|uniref:DUF4307 domain-containing protein n=1 Tax=Streptomyces chisholmiae TaxID=3075540 RepID=A0ABU2JK46_9ACTN|nr:DUF4307 domain-containing protein [Streptomyces sp. DSM 44915]MDT0265360.1 DUF4307 domain-containing protein [Streptomyces sp. DSM 44915]
MSQPSSTTVPPGRYGRTPSDEASTDRRLRLVGLVLGAALVAFVAWAGFSYINETKVSGELTGFTVNSDEEIDVRLAIRKPADVEGVCTVRAQAEDGLEVGRAEFRFPQQDDSLHRSVTVRTMDRATSAELMGCSAAGQEE